MVYIACFLWGIVCASHVRRKIIGFSVAIAGTAVLAYLDSIGI